MRLPDSEIRTRLRRLKNNGERYLIAYMATCEDDQEGCQWCKCHRTAHSVAIGSLTAETPEVTLYLCCGCANVFWVSGDVLGFSFHFERPNGEPRVWN